VSRVLAKLQARDRAQLVMLAYETGLVTPARVRLWADGRSRLRLQADRKERPPG